MGTLLYIKSSNDLMSYITSLKDLATENQARICLRLLADPENKYRPDSPITDKELHSLLLKKFGVDIDAVKLDMGVIPLIFSLRRISA